MMITYRASGGKLIHVTCEREGKIKDIRITGDFFLIPEESIESLERSLIGITADKSIVERKVMAFFDRGKTLLGATPEDFLYAILLAIGMRRNH